MTNIVNLKHIDNNSMKQIIQFFQEQEKLGVSVWKKNTNYTLADGRSFIFKNDVFKRERKAGHNGVRYELISNKKPLGEGGFGTVIKIKGTVALEDEGIRYKKQGKDGKRRVVKIQNHTLLKNPLADLQREYLMSARATHLSIKNPTVMHSSANTETSYTAMRLLPGRELFDFIVENKLTTQQRLQLTQALLYALKEQVTSKGMVHRDIKPENIMVHLGPPLQVNIIDYGLTMDMNQSDGKIYCTPGYYAPEISKNPLSVNATTDVFSMARVIALLWGVSFLTYDKRYNYLYERATPEKMLENIFSNAKGLDLELKNIIQTTLIGMLHPNPQERFTIDLAIENLCGQIEKRRNAALTHTFFVDKEPKNNVNSSFANANFKA